MPNTRPHDHIGNFNFMLEIEGVTQGAFLMVFGAPAEGADAAPWVDVVFSYNAVAGLPGDFNGDGVVNAQDYAVWRDAVVDAADYTVWRDGAGGWAVPGFDGKGNDVVTEEIALVHEFIQRAGQAQGREIVPAVAVSVAVGDGKEVETIVIQHEGFARAEGALPLVFGGETGGEDDAFLFIAADFDGDGTADALAIWGDPHVDEKDADFDAALDAMFLAAKLADPGLEPLNPGVYVAELPSGVDAPEPESFYYEKVEWT